MFSLCYAVNHITIIALRHSFKSYFRNLLYNLLVIKSLLVTNSSCYTSFRLARYKWTLESRLPSTEKLKNTTKSYLLTSGTYLPYVDRYLPNVDTVDMYLPNVDKYLVPT